MIIKEDQKSMAWLIKRRSRIGATDFAILFDEIEFPNSRKGDAIQKIIHEKINGKNDFISDYAIQGHEREGAIIARISSYTGIDFERNVTALYDKNEYLASSLDGYNEENFASVEAKTVTITSKNFWDNLEKGLQKWLGQIIHQKYTANLKRIYLGIEFQHYSATDQAFDVERKDFIAIDCISGEIIIIDMPHTPSRRIHMIKQFLQSYLTIPSEFTEEKWLEINNSALSALDDARCNTEI